MRTLFFAAILACTLLACGGANECPPTAPPTAYCGYGTHWDGMHCVPGDATTAATPDAVPNLLGTHWLGEDSNNDTFELWFQPSGKLRYKTKSGTWDNGRWSQNGAVVLMDMNNHYSDYQGTIVGTQISGTASNTTGLKWTWLVNRQP